jgi:formylglycine-generating enzyme required for sulfatase activity
MSAPVFITHSSRDYKQSKAIVDALEKRGIACWISERDIAAGDNYGDAIVDAIEAANAVVLVFSANANNSEEIKKEIALASQRKIVVIPIRLEDATPSKAFRYELVTRNWIDFFSDWEQGIERLADRILSIERAAGRPEPTASIQTAQSVQPIPPPAPAANVGRMSLIAIGGVAVLAAGAAFFLFQGHPAGHQDAAVNPAAATNTAAAVAVAPAAAAPIPVAMVAASAPVTVARAPAQIAASGSPKPPVPASPRPAQGLTQTAALVPIMPLKPNSAPQHQGVQVGPPPPFNADTRGGQVFKECAQCPEMVVVPRGSAILGSPVSEPGREANEAAPHEVDIPAPFAVGRYAVTFDEWGACVADGGCNHYSPDDYGFGRGNRPVIFVSWNDAQAYVDWLKKKTGAPYRLLSETEWEYAARGCASATCPNTPFWFGSIRPEVANYDSRYAYEGSPKAQRQQQTVPVDTGAPNPFGLYNMLGNVQQWVEDCWSATPSSAQSGAAPVLTGDCADRVIRGGSWADKPEDLRAAARSWDTANDRDSPNVGIRVARTLSP